MSKPLVPWIGGKRKLAKHLLPLFPDHTCYVEPFAGAAAIYFMKEPSKFEVVNDINGDIVNLYRVVKHHMEELYSQFKWVLCSRQNWEWLQSTPPETLTDIQRAARFLYLQKQAFGGKVSGQTYGTSTTSRPRFNLLTLENDLVDTHMRLTHTTVEHLLWDKCVKKYDRPHTLIYFDPPYWQTEGYGVGFPWEEYVKLRAFIDSCESKVVLSINNHPDIIKLFDGINRRDIDYAYSVGGNNRPKPVTELIYTNF